VFGLKALDHFRPLRIRSTIRVRRLRTNLQGQTNRLAKTLLGVETLSIHSDSCRFQGVLEERTGFLLERVSPKDFSSIKRSRPEDSSFPRNILGIALLGSPDLSLSDSHFHKRLTNGFIKTRSVCHTGSRDTHRGDSLEVELVVVVMIAL